MPTPAPPRPVLPSTLAHGLAHRAERHPRRLAVAFSSGDGQWQQLRYAELWQRAAGAAQLLRAVAGRGTGPRFVVIALPNGLDYVASVYACLIAGVVAVPFYPPTVDTGRALRAFHQRLAQIAGDCRPALVIVPADLVEPIRDELPGVPVLAVTDLPTAPAGSSAGTIGARPADLALLQYTSGSTTAPKGVMVSHANLVHNTGWMGSCLSSSEGESVTTWLPLFHDMGLIGMMLHPIAAGMSVHLLTPAAFVRRPRLWLETISRTRSAITMAPNFAYGMTVRWVNPQQRAGLDLSCLRHAVNGAEPVREATVDAFVDAYRPSGLRPRAMTPAYGLAEYTLCVSMFHERQDRPRLAFSTVRLRHDRVAVPAGPGEGRTVLFGCGYDIAPDSESVIVDPETAQACPDGTVGEIWCTGPSVAQGYWGLPDASAQTFAATLPDDGRTFLRTGDLGVKVDDVVYVAGRLKDVIIQRGVNHYPQDVEYTAEAAHPAVQPGGAVVFAIDDDRTAVLVCELARHGPTVQPDAVIGAVRRAVAAEHGLELAAVALVRRGQVPKTTSGKVRRAASAQRWRTGDFDPVAVWEPARATARAAVQERTAA